MYTTSLAVETCIFSFSRDNLVFFFFYYQEKEENIFFPPAFSPAKVQNLQMNKGYILTSSVDYKCISYYIFLLPKP